MRRPVCWAPVREQRLYVAFTVKPIYRFQPMCNKPHAAEATPVCQAWHSANGVQVPAPGDRGAEGQEQDEGAIARCALKGSDAMVSGEELTAGTPGDDTPVGVTHHPDNVCRTAGEVSHTSGGVGGWEGRPSLLPDDAAEAPLHPRCREETRHHGLIL
jgi:hypothetical protein